MSGLWGAGVLGAAPVVTNLVACQPRRGEPVVIRYDLDSSIGPVMISLEASADGGLNYDLPVCGARGDVGFGIAPGKGKSIEWPASNLGSLRVRDRVVFRIRADDGAEGGCEYDPDADEYCARSQVVGTEARNQLNRLIRSLKQEGLWDTIVVAPAMSDHGALQTLGGSAFRGNSDYLAAGSAQVMTDGCHLAITGGWPNHIRCTAVHRVEAEPVTYWQVSCTGAGEANLATSGRAMVARSGSGVMADLIYLGFGGDPIGQWLCPYYAAGSIFRADNGCLVTQRRPYLQGYSWDGGNVMRALNNNLLVTTSSGTLSVGRPAGEVCHIPQTPTGSGVIQCVGRVHGMLEDRHARLWPILGCTLLQSTNRAPFHVIYLCGQSNASFTILRWLALDSLQATGTPLFSMAYSGRGGVALENWIGPVGAQTRTTDYRNHFGEQSFLQGSTRLQGMGQVMPRSITDPTKIRKWLIWVQGESDTEPWVYASTYKTRLKKLLEWLREDHGAELRVCVVKVDYSEPQRNTVAWMRAEAAQGNTSRTERLEMVRQAQQEVADEDPLTVAVDSRGCERPGDTWDGVTLPIPDTVHMTTQGYRTLAGRIWQAISNEP